MSAPVVKLTYIDSMFEYEEGDAEEPAVVTVVGFDIPSRFNRHIAIAAESTPYGYRAITHVPNGSVLDRLELH